MSQAMKIKSSLMLHTHQMITQYQFTGYRSQIILLIVTYFYIFILCNMSLQQSVCFIFKTNDLKF